MKPVNEVLYENISSEYYFGGGRKKFIVPRHNIQNPMNIFLKIFWPHNSTHQIYINKNNTNVLL